MFRWLLKALREKVNFPKVYSEIKELGKKHGKRFFWAALIWEAIEDLVFPFIAWLCGVPELIPIFLVLHFEPIVYPAFFWGFRMWDRAHGREPWEPNRPAHSAYWRSAVKVLVFQLTSLGWLSQIVPWKPLVIFTILVSLFGFIHERIWHDSNFGILPNDDVEFKRTAGKTGTYLIISTINLYSLLKVFGSHDILRLLGMSYGIIGFLYMLLEAIWAKSLWGVSQTEKEAS